jgi:hypothetical protein
LLHKQTLELIAAGTKNRRQNQQRQQRPATMWKSLTCTLKNRGCKKQLVLVHASNNDDDVESWCLQVVMSMAGVPDKQAIHGIHASGMILLVLSR